MIELELLIVIDTLCRSGMLETSQSLNISLLYGVKEEERVITRYRIALKIKREERKKKRMGEGGKGKRKLMYMCR